MTGSIKMNNLYSIYLVDVNYEDILTESKLRHVIVWENSEEECLALVLKCTSKNKKFTVPLEDWRSSGLDKPTYAYTNRLLRVHKDNLTRCIGKLSERDLISIIHDIYAKDLTAVDA